jgi:hypothetical protein
MTFRIHALAADQFAPLFAMDDTALAAANARRMIVDADPGYPCRVSLEDGRIGETVILVNHVSMSAATPYRASHAVYIRENAVSAEPGPGKLPVALARRLLSLRAFDGAGMLRCADVAEGDAVPAMIEEMLADPAVAEIHLHHARQGCYAARATRA